MLNTSVARGDLTSRSREEELDKLISVNVVKEAVDSSEEAKQDNETSPVKAGGNVDLDEPRLQSRIKEDVKSKEFIAGVPATPVKL